MKIVNNKKLILASASPRRKELLSRLIEASDAPENAISVEPNDVCRELSQIKCNDIASRHMDEEAIIVSADTIVTFENTILGKPQDEEDALKMLMSLSGREHTVYTGVTICSLPNGAKTTFGCATYVKMYDFNKQEAIDYIKTAEPMDKAGAYGIQGLGGLLVESINGDYNNVVGFPLALFVKKMKEMGLMC